MDRRKVLSVSYVIQAGLFALLGLAGMRCYFDHGHGAAASPLESARTFEGMLWVFVAIFAAIGLIQSVDLPSLIAVMGNWTDRGNRGVVTGLWSTCQSAGNILGLQIAPILLSQWQGRWYCLMFVAAVVYASIGVLMFTFLVPDPRLIGIRMPREETSHAGSVLAPPSEDDAHLLALGSSLSAHSPPIVEPDSEPSDR